LVLGKSRNSYHAFYLQQRLAENAAIPTDVSYEDPIQLRRIINRSCKYFSAVPANESLFIFIFSYSIQ
jgi:hypothetical protein